VHKSLQCLAAIGMVLGWSLGMKAQTPARHAGEAHLAASSTSPDEFSHSEQIDDPVADPKAIVVFGHARFTVLTPEMIRMEWSADGKFEDHASFVFINRRLPTPKFTRSIELNGHRLIIDTAALSLTYTPSSDGAFTADNLSIKLKVDGKEVVWHPGMDNAENLLGTTRTLDGALGSKTKEPIGPGLISREGWTLVDDSTRPLFDSADFQFVHGEKSPWPWVMERPAYEQPGKYVDWYFFGYGHDYRKALGDYVRVAGRIPLPPRFAFGVWWSRYWAYSDQELDQLVRGFHENSTPLNVLVIDMDWHINEEQLKAMGETDQSGQRLGWTGYTWNKLLFPDPDAFLKKLHEEGLKVTLNLHPASGIQPWEQAYPAMARAMGIDPTTRKYVPFDPTDKKWATNYFDLVLHPLEKEGIDFWWLDWQQQPMTKLPGVNNTWWLNYLHFTDQQREGKRPLLFHRWGGLGNHRYEIGFSGDTISVWPSLAFQPWFTATAANVGYAYWSHDIGGHMPGAVDPELFTRWVQFGAFSPILRTHTTKNPEAERRIWAYPEPYSSILRATYQLRMALQPYIYTEARRTYDTGVAFLHPLYYDWPEADAAYTSKNEYMFGDEMLAAPVTEPADPVTGLATEKIWLPRGDWIEWPTGKHFSGPVTVERSFSIDQIPIYLRAGAIVPMQPTMEYTGQKPVDPLIVNVWPLEPGASSSYSVYADSGVSVLYQRGVLTQTPIHATEDGSTLRVEIGPVRGGFPGMLKARAYELRLPADWPPDSVTVNGKPVPQGQPGKPGWSFIGNTLTTVIPTARFSTAERVTIEARRAPGLIAQRGELDGFAGAMTRLHGAYEAIQQTWPVVEAPPDALIDAMQTGDRLGYHPERAAEEMAHFHEGLARAEAAVAAIAPGFAQRMDDYARQMARNPLRPSNMQAEEQRRTDLLHRAERLMNEVEK
jgi:alpha-glucosidase (family GH31 glycosyl hydrolase)